ncbi:MAG TPA: hypothetical protein VL096_07640, partial [Pirellulaceae bacterium]|nr:hypothetical protein [Pirellulaceae bacterium]
LYEPPADKAAWDFLTRTTHPALTATETAAYLQGDQSVAPAAQRWTTLEPLSRKHYRLETRARDLLERMLAAKINRAQGIFLPDPFSPQHGVVQADGTPDELLLPWRTTATLLGGAEYLGSIHLPGGSVNHLFRRDQQAIMVLWNDRPTQETLFLGEQIEHFDLWGRTIPHATVDQDGAPTQQLSIGRLPSFVTGLSLPIAQWRIRFAFETTHLPSVFGKDQLAKFTFINTFAQSVGGEVRVHPPLNWEVTPLATNFRAAAGEPRQESFQVRFKSEAESGRQLLRFDLTLTADHDYRFSVYQPIHVGLDDVTIETSTRLNDEGQLIVEQVINNRTDEFVSFNCLLFAPGRRRERLQVLELGRGRHVSSFVLPRGEELIGQPLQLRAEEMNGDRVLNYQVLPVE